MRLLETLFSPFGELSAEEAKRGVTYFTWLVVFCMVLILALFSGSDTLFASSSMAGEMNDPGMLIISKAFIPMAFLCGWVRFVIMLKRSRAEGEGSGTAVAHAIGFAHSAAVNGGSPGRKANKQFKELVYGDDEPAHMKNLGEEVDLVARARQLQEQEERQPAKTSSSATFGRAQADQTKREGTAQPARTARSSLVERPRGLFGNRPQGN